MLRIESDNPFSKEEFSQVLADSVKRCFGEVGAGRINAKLIRFDHARSEAVVGCSRESVAELETAMALTTNISGRPAAALTLRVSGTIKGLRKRKRR